MLYLQEQHIWFYFKGSGVYFTNRLLLSRTRVTFLSLVTMWVNVLGESR